MAKTHLAATTARSALLAKQIAKDWWMSLVGLLVLASMLVFFNQWTLLKRLDLVLYDLQSTVFNKKLHSPTPQLNTALIIIDDYSLARLGYWPWRRAEYARALAYLDQAKAVGIDIVFQDQNPAFPHDDELLAAQISQHGRVVLANTLSDTSPPQVHTPLPRLHQAAAGSGYINIYPDDDGTVRQAQLHSITNQQQQLHFSLAMLAAGGDEPLVKELLARNADTLIPFLGPAGTFETYSFADLVEGRIAADTFKDRYVVIGAWSSGLGDYFPTPLSTRSQANMAGVEILANILENARQQHWIRTPPTLIIWAFNLLPILFVYIVLRRLPPRAAILGATAVLLFILTSSWLLLHLWSIWVPTTAGLIGTTLAYPLWYWRSQETVLRYINNEISAMRKQDPLLSQAIQRNTGYHSLPERLAHLHKAIELLRESQQRREETLRFISHDMRAPQNSILALITMHRRQELQFGVEPMLDRVENYAKNTLSLVDDFMDLARVEAMELQFEPVLLNEVLAEVCDDAWARAQAKQIKIVCREPEQLIWVSLSTALFKRALVNLIDNAIKYSSENTTVECHLIPTAHHVFIRIHDQGWGIPKKDLATIFQPFKRAHTTTKGGPSGSGLGLAFVHTVILRNLGHISVQSTVNVGTEFIIKLPTIDEP